MEFDSYKTFDKIAILQPNLIELLNPHLKRDSNKNHYFEKIRKAEIFYQKLISFKGNLKISTIRNDELDSSSEMQKLDVVARNEKNKENELLKSSKRLKENPDENKKENECNGVNDTGSNLKILNKKKSFVDLSKSIKSQFIEDEKVIEEQGRTITTTCNIQ